jgi:cytochrome c oxidase subunit 1
MSIFSVSYHIAGLRGLPRRVYSASLTGDQGAPWHFLTLVAAQGGILLFLSALCFLTVVIATWTSGKKIDAPPFEFAVPLRPVAASIWDRFGLWTIVAIVLIAAAYAYPLAELLSHPRYGSPGFRPY